MRLALLVAVLWLVPAWAGAQTGNEEAKCTDAAVFLCENWQDNALGNIGTAARYKQNGWGSAGSEFQIISATGPQGTTVHVLDEIYPDCSVPCSSLGESNGGGGFTDSTFSAGHSELYHRHYEKWTSNWVHSDIGSKNLEYNPSNCCNLYIWHGHFTDPQLYMQHGTSSFTGVFTQNQNQTDITLNTWHCLESHVIISAGASGASEAWLDGVQVVKYTGQQTWDSSATMDGLKLSMNWNCVPTFPPGSDCTGQHPAGMHRYITNIIVSTAAVGCLGAAPSASSSHRFLWVKHHLWLLVSAGTLAALAAARTVKL